jgi:hypothetical protein
MILKIGDMVKLSQAGIDDTIHYSLKKDYGFIVAFDPPTNPRGDGLPEPRVSWVRSGAVIDHYSWEVEAVSEA